MTKHIPFLSLLYYKNFTSKSTLSFSATTKSFISLAIGLIFLFVGCIYKETDCANHKKNTPFELDNQVLLFSQIEAKIDPLSELPTLVWASEIAAHDDVSIVSGFRSQLERRVRDLLLKSKCRIICVLARSLYSKVPTEYKSAFDCGRVLFITEEKQSRATKDSSHRRNKIIVSLSDELVTPVIAPDSSLSAILSSFNKTVLTL